MCFPKQRKPEPAEIWPSNLILWFLCLEVCLPGGSFFSLQGLRALWWKPTHQFLQKHAQRTPPRPVEMPGSCSSPHRHTLSQGFSLFQKAIVGRQTPRFCFLIVFKFLYLQLSCFTYFTSHFRSSWGYGIEKFTKTPSFHCTWKIPWQPLLEFFWWFPVSKLWYFQRRQLLLACLHRRFGKFMISVLLLASWELEYNRIVIDRSNHSEGYCRIFYKNNMSRATEENHWNT